MVLSIAQKYCETIQHFLAVAPYINQFVIDDIGLFICDTETVIWDVVPQFYCVVQKGLLVSGHSG